jgi:hypothetical protein
VEISSSSLVLFVNTAKRAQSSSWEDEMQVRNLAGRALLSAIVPWYAGGFNVVPFQFLVFVLALVF